MVVQFSQLRYRKTGSTSTTDDYGSAIVYYEYELPQGWQLTTGYVGQSTTSGLVIGTNNVSVQPDDLSGGKIRVRAINTQCGDYYNKSKWSEISISRQVLNLVSGGSTSVNINCGDNSARSFTVENGNLATCASFIWTVGSNWLYNGNPAPSTITTSSPSITISPISTLVQPPTDIIVNVTAGSSSFKDTAKVTFTNNKPNLTYSTANFICSSEVFELQNIPTGANVTWSTSKTCVVQISTQNSTGSQAQ